MEAYEEAVQAAQARDTDRLTAVVEAHPKVLTHRPGENDSLLQSLLSSLLVGDWSKPPAILPDPEGAGLRTIECLLDLGADVNERLPSGWTPLHTAQYQNHVELTELLLARGADPHAVAYAPGGTPLLQALFWGHSEAADALAACDVTPKNLRVAAGLGRVSDIAACFDGDDLTAAARADRDYYRPHTDFPDWEPTHSGQETLDDALSYAARNRRRQAVDALLDRGADIDGEAYNGTALHWAVHAGDLGLVRHLLSRGANPNRSAQFGTQWGVTPLHTAAWLDRVEIARALLDAGADPELRDTTHDSPPLGWAEFLGSPGVAALLRGQEA